MASRRVLGSGVFVLLGLFAAAAYAQEASVIGSVTDETKAVLPGATITATNLETGAQSNALTDERGQFRLLSLPAGKYRVQVELAGFSTVVVPGVELLVGQNATM